MKALGPSKGHHFFPREISLSCYLSNYITDHTKYENINKSCLFYTKRKIHKNHQTKISQLLTLYRPISCTSTFCMEMCLWKVHVHIYRWTKFVIPYKMSGFLSFTSFGSRYNVIRGAQEAVKNGIWQEAGPLGWISRTFQMKLSEIFVWNMFEIGTILQASWASWDPKTSNFQSYFCQGAINRIHICYDIYCSLDLMQKAHKNAEMYQLCHFTKKNSAKKLARFCRLLGLKNAFCNVIYSKKCH